MSVLSSKKNILCVSAVTSVLCRASKAEINGRVHDQPDEKIVGIQEY